ncbi:MAG: hypothetical protein A2381_07920 [Bdellovibrionales bacterium RIFOXYB1_FULL_37_110]|nr:MAG: hypothetical protein A2181_04685 [Bdellovibrionales bacterium RIFOXYA1_FULL_38_20]OFZ52530.1 MAG: hypothetical protein A2417_00640 [Bdellovibrionales bacterium RIFOXYC1_FULL_37_79]OFZ59732.1 MAG: hypothetical protein A2381_07920 [Bdellovibrionales bacterium RIFOXYB1_FULL_37_110]OFZ63543.1 MAG: hypothetical protein A2577_15860 [Bdellovibrionales bacterium RIFOXYD1_FULL_36_51]
MKFLVVIFVVFLCFTRISQLVLAAETSISCGELLKQIVVENDFGSSSGKAVNRGSLEYFENFGEEFVNRVVDKASSADHVMDMGAGNAIFARDLAGQTPGDYGQQPRLQKRILDAIPKVTAISYKTQHPISNFDGFTLLTGRFFEDIPSEELIQSYGEVSVFTDFWGVMAYTKTPHLVLKKVLKIAQNDFIYFLKVSSVRSSLNDSTVLLQNGVEISLVDWFKTIPGLEISMINLESFGEAIAITANNKEFVEIPLLELISINDNVMPPARKFKVVVGKI